MPTITPVQFLSAFYPKRQRPGQLILWSKSRRGGKKHCDWTRTLDQAARLAKKYRPSRDVYFGASLQDEKAAVKIARRRRPRAQRGAVRGCEESAVALPTIWATLNVAGPGRHSNRRHSSGRHSNRRHGNALPPDREAALGLLSAVPRPPSIIVDSGGGFDLYWLLREPLLLRTDVDRAAAKRLVCRVQEALRGAARAQGWGVDDTANLAHLLRLPGTLNHKLSPSRPVTVEHFPLAVSFDDWRYDPADFDTLGEPPEIPGRDHELLRGAGGESAVGPPADFRRVLAGCVWLRHCYNDRTSLPEREWHAALSLIGRCTVGDADGRRLAHRMSRDHPGYTVSGTDETLEHVLASSGPRSCADIAGRLGQRAAYCGPCPHLAAGGSPLQLGRSQPTAPPLRQVAENPQPVVQPVVPPKPPEILLTAREDEVNNRALAALAESGAGVFQRRGVLVHVVPVLDRSAGGMGHGAIRPLGEAGLRERLTRACAFVKPVAGRLKPAHPPIWMVRALLGRGCWPELPELAGVTGAPLLRGDGSVLQEPGFDATTGWLYRPDQDFEPVPAHPEPGQIQAALALLRETVCDFPFLAEAHYAAWLCALLTPLARLAFAGPSPLNLIDANVAGSGKSLLVDVIATLLTGRPAARTSYTRDEEEMRKQITGLAAQDTQLALIDNVSVLASATLDRALTAATWRDRLLGSNTQVSVPLVATWYATGNNVVLAGDTGRRALHIRLESRCERPEQRTGFRHPRLLAWVARQRGRLLPAALTLLRAYTAAGRPSCPLPAWGSYEGWSDLVRSTVVWLGLPDPAETRQSFEAANDEGEPWSEVA